ncbi:MAG TPA: hypothetical protein VF095_06075 [Bacillota bacterium]
MYRNLHRPPHSYRSLDYFDSVSHYPVEPPHYMYPFEQGYQGYARTPFDQYAKPKQPKNWYESMHQPYTDDEQAPMALHRENRTVNFEQIDLEKMLSTVGQLAETYQRVSPIVKEIGALLKKWK